MIERIVFVDGSNAKNLSQAAAMLGIDAYMIAKGGWKLTRENVDKLLPDFMNCWGVVSLQARPSCCSVWTTPASWLPRRTEEGGMVPMSKCVPGDTGYHVNRALVVAPERALQHSVEQLRRIVDEFADFDLFIVSPLMRYVARPCCVNTGHVTNFGEPGFLQNIISDLTKLKFKLRKKLPLNWFVVSVAAEKKLSRLSLLAGHWTQCIRPVMCT